MRKLAMFTVLLVVMGQCGVAQCVLFELGTLGGVDSNAHGINDACQVVGISDTARGDYHAFLWLPEPAYNMPAGMNDLGTLGGAYGWANGINDACQVTGYSATAWDWHAFLWLPEPAYGLPAGMNHLGALGGTYSNAYAINEARPGRGPFVHGQRGLARLPVAAGAGV